MLPSCDSVCDNSSPDRQGASPLCLPCVFSISHPKQMPEMSLSEGFLKIIKTANRFHEADSCKRLCKPFLVEGKQVGWIHPDILRHLKHFPDIFSFVSCLVTGEIKHVAMSFDLNTYESRSEKMGEVLQELRKKDNLVALKGWRDEEFEVWHKLSEPPLMKLERSATSLFGVRQYGVHVNGYVYHSTKGLSMWIGRRSKTKPTWPGKLDQMAAGGLPSGMSVLDSMKNECREEASVPEKYLQKLKPVGTVSYFYEDERGLFPETQYVYDLELPEDFEPVNSDGEVESFELIALDKVKELIVGDDFKFNCSVVILDFLIRHSLITPEEEPNYVQLVQGIHTPLS